MSWIAFDVDNPSKSFVCEETEAEIDKEVTELETYADEVVKREFPNVSADDVLAIVDVVMQ